MLFVGLLFCSLSILLIQKNKAGTNHLICTFDNVQNLHISITWWNKLMQNAAQGWRKQVLGFSFYHPKLIISKPLVATGRKIQQLGGCVFHSSLCVCAHTSCAIPFSRLQELDYSKVPSTGGLRKINSGHKSFVMEQWLKLSWWQRDLFLEAHWLQQQLLVLYLISNRSLFHFLPHFSFCLKAALRNLNCLILFTGRYYAG